MTCASQFVRKDCARHGLSSLTNGIACIHCTNEGIAEAPRPVAAFPKLVRRFVHGSRGRPRSPPLLGQPLTPREREIVALLGTGLRLRHVAAHLKLDSSTVANHQSVARDKLGVSSTRFLGAYAIEHGITV